MNTKQAKQRFGIIGNCVELERSIDISLQVAATAISVLIIGESGTGKELVAHNIHSKSNRSSAPFVEVNCAAIPSELIESELFGNIKGAFT